jgi:hypothetical protein
MAQITWLASYAKSGSTWFSLLFDQYWGGEDIPQDVLHPKLVRHASLRKPFDRAAGIDSSLLTQEEAEALRPLFYEYHASITEDPLFLKIHDACITVKGGSLIVPPQATKIVFYLIRNPLDVAVSFSHHFDFSLDGAISFMNDENAVFSNQEEQLYGHFRQRVLTWSGHVESWVDAKALTVHVIRYEDLVSEPHAVFSSVLRLAGIDPDMDKVEKVIRNTSFSRLQSLEKEYGFYQNMRRERTFFRKGKIGSWREELSPEQTQRIANDHQVVMRRFGYLGENDKIVY